LVSVVRFINFDGIIKMDTDKKVVIVLICLSCLFLVRSIRMQYAYFDFEDYASDYVEWVKETDGDANVSYRDVDIIRDKMLPNFWSTVMNLFKWTDEQISSDDKILKKCKTVWEVKEKERKTKQIIAETTFSEREATWRKGEKKTEP
jgi:hypothetical protein